MPSVSDPGYFCTNGMSESRHDSPFANSGLVVTIEPDETGSDHPLAGIHYQQRYRAPGLHGGRAHVRGADPVGQRLPRRPPQPGDDPDELSARRQRPIDLRLFLPDPVVEALRARPPGDGPAVRRPLPPRRHAHRPRVARQLARPDRPRPGRPARAPASPGSIPAAKGPATPAGSSARPSTACGRHGRSSPRTRIG